MLSVDICHDILAIRCIDSYIFVGIGTKLHVFNSIDFKCKLITDTDHQDIIHDIVKNGSDKLIIFGGKYLSIFSYKINQDELIVNKLSTHIFNDWIISSSFYSINNTEDIYILFAHNNLYLYNTSSKEYTNVLCEEKCILYCGFISAEKDQVVIFSGTVFKEILIWKVNIKIDVTKDINVLYRLKGHKGVIFSIFYDEKQKLITTTSDDRTIRLWEIDNKMNETENYWDNLIISLKATMFGHTARVWKSLIVNDKIISVGEDSYIFIWTLEGKVCNKIIAHEGSAVWTLEISRDKSTIFTGGANGGVNCWPLINDETTALLPKLSFIDKQIPKYLSYLNNGDLIVFLDSGQLLTYDKQLCPKDSIILPKYKSYCLMQVSSNRKLIAFASKDGYVDVFHEVNDKLELFKDPEKIIESKIYSIQWLDDNSMLICGDKGHLKVIKIDVNNKFNVQCEFTLPSSRECWTTAAIKFNNLIICGDRAGNVYGFDIKSDSRTPQYNFSKIHGRLGVQSFGSMNNKLLSTGRDGTLRFYKLIVNNNDENNTLLKVLDGKKMPMEWVSRTLKTNNDLYVIGFKEIEFIIYSMRFNRLVLRITCGGGHRSWDCIYINDVIKFSCIKNKQVYMTDNILCQFSDTLITGFHTKEIHSVEILPVSNKNHMIFISASEDCTLRLSNLQLSLTNEIKLNYLDTYHGHISNVKAIAVVNLIDTNEETKNLVFTVGGRAQLKVWEITVDIDKNILTNDDVSVVELATFMIRDIDKCKRKTFQQKQQTYFIDPETRFMDVRAYLNSENKIIVFIACSDGYLRIMSYDISLHEIKLINEISYYNRCIIKIHSFLHEKELILISMATDGFINLWSVNSIIYSDDGDRKIVKEPFKLWIAHQSGINSYDFCKKDKNYLLLTGGDDNKICLTIFNIVELQNKVLDAKIIADWNSTLIHCAQITGVKFYGENNFASVAIDQRIVMYHYSLTNSILSVTPLIKLIKLTSVADVHGITFVSNVNDNKPLACVYGQGIEVIEFEKQNLN
ncbi:WD repeat-containing protein 6 [Microplitis mediator]|uniref:WD repeat-containing protein 6 n=1 Tax=Microplitis mediator TaxID=375433 RepID=UPI0025561FE3|nr:WD repeat-containing protein 6 [Microplitis mediator]